MDKRHETVLAIDPGLREMGYAVLAGRRYVTSGVKELRLVPPPRRMTEARRAVQGWITAYRPRVLVLEQTNRHPTGSFHSLHQLARTLARVAKSNRLRVASYAPQTVRKHLVGNGKCTKAELARILAVRYPELRVNLTQDRKWKERFWHNASDAVGLAVYHRLKR